MDRGSFERTHAADATRGKIGIGQGNGRPKAKSRRTDPSQPPALARAGGPDSSGFRDSGHQLKCGFTAARNRGISGLPAPSIRIGRDAGKRTPAFIEHSRHSRSGSVRIRITRCYCTRAVGRDFSRQTRDCRNVWHQTDSTTILQGKRSLFGESTSVFRRFADWSVGRHELGAAGYPFRCVNFGRRQLQLSIAFSGCAGRNLRSLSAMSAFVIFARMRCRDAGRILPSPSTPPDLQTNPDRRSTTPDGDKGGPWAVLGSRQEPTPSAMPELDEKSTPPFFVNRLDDPGLPSLQPARRCRSPGRTLERNRDFEVMFRRFGDDEGWRTRVVRNRSARSG